MYVLATLCFIKIYQFRHPDITSNAYKVFFGLGVIMLLEVAGNLGAPSNFAFLAFTRFKCFTYLSLHSASGSGLDEIWNGSKLHAL